MARNRKAERIVRQALDALGAEPDTQRPLCPVPGCTRRCQRRAARPGERKHFPACRGHWQQYLYGTEYKPYNDGVRSASEDMPERWYGRGAASTAIEPYEAMLSREEREFTTDMRLRKLAEALERRAKS